MGDRQMSIDAILARMHGSLDDCRGAVLIGLDGLIVEKHGIEDASLEALAVEFITLFSKFNALAREQGGEGLTSAAIGGEDSAYFFSRVTDDYILFLAVGRNELNGKSRFVLTKAAYDLRRELTRRRS